jgi:hypothetical protein
VPRFFLQFRTEPEWAYEIHAALGNAGIELVGNYGSSAQDAIDAEYRPDTHVVLLEANDAHAALRAVTQAVQETAGFEPIRVLRECIDDALTPDPWI